MVKNVPLLLFDTCPVSIPKLKVYMAVHMIFNICNAFHYTGSTSSPSYLILTISVILTACATTKGGMLSTKLIDFTDVRAVSGIRNVSHIKTSGQFTCEQSGLYQISAFVMSEIQGANLLLLKNNINTLAYGHFPRVAGSYSTSTIVVFAELSENDTIGARIQSTRGRYVTFFGSGQSCLSVQKVKWRLMSNDKDVNKDYHYHFTLYISYFL